VLDADSGKMIEDAMKKAGVEIVHGNEIVEVTGGDKVEGVVLKDGKKLPCEIVIFGIGTTSQLDWVKASGVACGRGIIADEFMATNVTDVWTAGDIAEYNDLLLEERVQMGNWVSAHEQGRVAGLGMIGKPEAFKFISFYTTQGFGLTVAFVGDASPGADRTVVARGSAESGSYGRILVAHGEIEGATLLNRTQEMGTISKLIEKNIKVSAKMAEIGDTGFDLKKLLA
jgi:NAD(P)H-nitrite reductase large subunit